MIIKAIMGRRGNNLLLLLLFSLCIYELNYSFYINIKRKY